VAVAVATDAPEADVASETKPAAAPPIGDRPVSAAEDLETLRSLWPAVVDLVRVENALLGALIAEAQPAAVAGEDLTVAFASTAQFLKKKAEDPAHRVTLTEALRDITGRRWRMSYELREEESEGRERSERDGHTEEEWVRRFMEEFDAEELPGEWAPAQSGAPTQAGDGGEPASGKEKGA
jgi:hypothetical protein